MLKNILSPVLQGFSCLACLINNYLYINNPNNADNTNALLTTIPEENIDGKIYLVGGAVRDLLLQRPSSDNDFVIVGGNHTSMIKNKFRPVGADFPVYIHPISGDEYSLARVERKTSDGYHGFKISTKGVSLEDDLSRRDLTINSIAQNQDGDLIDPFNGVEDIRNKLIKHTSEAFSEDPLRILRVARFAARYHSLGFAVDNSTIELMIRMVNHGMIESLNPSRMWKEISRALMESKPSVFFKILQNTGALLEILPELEALDGIPQHPAPHPEVNTFTHIMMTIDHAAKLRAPLDVRYALLLHDLGKSLSPKETLPAHHDHAKSGVPLVERINRRFRIPKKIGNLAVLMCAYHTHAHKAFDLRAGSILKLLNHVGAIHNQDTLQSFLLACKCDAQGRLSYEDKPYPQSDFLLDIASSLKTIDRRKLVVIGNNEKTAEAIKQATIKHIKIQKSNYMKNLVD